MDNVVAEEGDEDGRDDQDEAACPWRQDSAVDDVQELGRGHDVDGTPADTGDGVDEGKDTHADVTHEEPGEDHLPEPEPGAKSGEEGDGDGPEDVEEDDAEDGGAKVEAKDGVGQGAKSESGDDHVGGEPHGGGVVDAGLCSLFDGDHFDTSGFSVEHRHDLCVPGVVLGLEFGFFDNGLFLLEGQVGPFLF